MASVEDFTSEAREVKISIARDNEWSTAIFTSSYGLDNIEACRTVAAPKVTIIRCQKCRFPRLHNSDVQ